MSGSRHDGGGPSGNTWEAGSLSQGVEESSHIVILGIFSITGVVNCFMIVTFLCDAIWN